jgi:hypothetical protein
MKHYVGTFNEKQLIAKEDKVAIEKAMSETNLKYIQSKTITKKGVKYLEVHLIDTETYLNQ